MIFQGITLCHVSKESHIIVRIEPDFRARLDRLATMERRTVSQLCRNVLEDFVSAQERAMNLVLRAKSTEEIKAAIGTPAAHHHRKKYKTGSK